MRRFLPLSLLLLAACGSRPAAWPPEPLVIACPPDKLSRLPGEVRAEVDALCSRDMDRRCDALERLETLGSAAAPAIPYLIELLADTSVPLKEDPKYPGQFLFYRGSEHIGYRAASALAAIGAPARDPLVRTMREAEPRIRRIAVYGLEKMGGLPSGEPFYEAFRDADAGVRGGALDALAARNDPQAVEYLLAGLRDESVNVRYHAALGLRRHPDPRAVEALAAAFEREDKDERHGAWKEEVDALGAIDDSRAVEALLRILKSRLPTAASFLQMMPAAQGSAEDAALYSLLITGEEPVIKEVQRVLEGTLRPSAVEPLISCLGDEEMFVRLLSAHFLLALKDPRAAGTLIGRKRDSSPLLRLAAVKALEMWKPPDAVEQLGALAADPSPGVRRQAVTALGGFGEPAEEFLAQALRDDDAAVRRLAAKPLVEVRSARGLEGLLPLAREPEAAVREPAIRALGDHPEPAATEAMVEALRDSEANIRVVAVEGLAVRTDACIERELFGALTDRDYRVVSAAARILSGSRRPETLDLFIGALEGPDPNQRNSAQMILARNDDPSLIPRLAALLKESGDVGTRRTAAGILGRKKGAGVEPLVAALRDRDRSVREAATSALSATGDPGALEPLFGLLAEPAFDSLVAVRALVALKDPRTVGRASVGLAGDDNQIRRKMVTLLGELRDPSAAEPLLKALRSDPDDSVRGLAARALQQIGAPGIIEPFIQALSDPGFSARAEAARALARMDDPRLEELFVLAVARGDAGQRARTVDALRLPSDPRAAKALVAALGDESAAVRAKAAVGLANKKAAGTDLPLLAALRDSDRTVRMNAAHALRALDVPAIRQPEVALLLCASKHENHPGAQEVERLIASLGDADKAVRREAALRLGSIGDETALEKLILTARKDPDDYVRQMAAVSLRGFCAGGPRIMDALIAFLKDPVEQVRSAAASALGELEIDGVRGRLRSCLGSDDPLVRIGASSAFRRRVARQDVPLLIEALRDPEYRVRQNAVETLKMLGDPAAVEAVIPLVEDPHPQVRQAARGALMYLAPGGDYNWPPDKWRAWWAGRQKSDP